MRRDASRRTAEAAPTQAVAASCFALPAECVVQEAQDLREQLLPLTEVTTPVTIDVHALQRIDTAGVQILAAFVEGRRREGLAVAWSGESTVLARAAELLGLQRLLQSSESRE